MTESDNVELFDTQLKNLRLSISDLGEQVDSYKAKTAAALGGGVFLLLVAAGAGYDLAFRKGGALLTLGVTRETLIWIVSGIGAAAAALLLLAIARIRRRDIDLDDRLDRLEQEYAELLEQRELIARKRR